MCVCPRGYKLHSRDIEPVYQGERVCYTSKCNKTILSMGVALVTKCIMEETNLITPYKSLVSLKGWLYTSNKPECFRYEGGCGIFISRHLKEVLSWAIFKYFQFSNNVIVITTNLPKNKAVLNLKIILYTLLHVP